MKKCCRCKLVKNFSEFSFCKRPPDGLCRFCRECDAKRNKEYALKYAEKRRNQRLLKKYGINSTEYDTMLQRQNGKCAICKKTNTIKAINGKSELLVVDHCHVTKRVRGLLCSKCNSGIGFLKDNVFAVQRAAEYLLNHHTVNYWNIIKRSV